MIWLSIAIFRKYNQSDIQPDIRPDIRPGNLITIRNDWYFFIFFSLNLFVTSRKTLGGMVGHRDIQPDDLSVGPVLGSTGPKAGACGGALPRKK